MRPATELVLQAGICGRAEDGRIVVLSDRVAVEWGVVILRYTVLERHPVLNLLEGISNLRSRDAVALIEQYRANTEAAELVVRAYLSDRLRELGRLDEFPPTLRGDR